MPKPYVGPPPILVGYDASDDAVEALEYAARVAAATKTMLQLVFVADNTVVNSAWGLVTDSREVQGTARKLLVDAAAVANALGVAKKRIRIKVAVGTPVGVLTQLSQHCSMVVVGRRTHGENRMISGSTAVGLAASVRCPLVIVADAPRTHDGPIGVAIEAGGPGAAALDWVLTNPLYQGQSVQVISICKAPQSRIFRSAVTQEQIDSAVAHTTAEQARQVRQVLARHLDPPPVTTEVRYGSPVDELSAFSESLSLLVLETDVRFPTYSIGSVARGLMTYAGCPVVLVK